MPPASSCTLARAIYLKLIDRCNPSTLMSRIFPTREKPYNVEIGILPMDRIKAAEKIVADMSAVEKSQFFQQIIRYLANFSPGIESDSNICGGSPRIIRTRIPVWLLVRARQLGTSEAEILQNYPSLRAEDLANAWSYYTFHQAEIEQEISENEAD